MVAAILGSEAFEGVFANKAHFSLALQRLAPIRNANAHPPAYRYGGMLLLIARGATHILKSAGVEPLPLSRYLVRRPFSGASAEAVVERELWIRSRIVVGASQYKCVINVNRRCYRGNIAFTKEVFIASLA